MRVFAKPLGGSAVNKHFVNRTRRINLAAFIFGSFVAEKGKWGYTGGSSLNLTEGKTRHGQPKAHERRVAVCREPQNTREEECYWGNAETGRKLQALGHRGNLLLSSAPRIRRVGTKVQRWFTMSVTINSTKNVNIISRKGWDPVLWRMLHPCSRIKRTSTDRLFCHCCFYYYSKVV